MVMTNALEHVLEKFPDRRVKIIELYDKDEEFRILCDDYLTSLRTLEQFRSRAVKSNPFEKEFMDLRNELEKELREILNSKRREW
jgi:hypothetical protein